MSTVDINLVMSNPIYLATIGLAFCGWIILLAGAAAAELEGGIWFFIVYQLFLIIGVIFTISTNSIQQYRISLVAFIVIGFVFLTSLVNLYIIYTASSTAQAACAGGIFILMVEMVWIFIFGTTEDSMIQTTISSFTVDNKPNPAYQTNGHQQQNITRAGPGIPMMPPPNTMQSPNVMQSQPQQQENLSTVVVSPNADYAYKAQALYEYQANPDDLNELSFSKGEILDIVDNKGKWWQARKADGSIGIAPSNYLQLI